MKVKVRTENDKVNQFEIDVDGDTYLQSYRSIIAKIDRTGKVFLDERYWSYSTTTSKHRNKFLNMTSKETEAKIKSGEITLVNLN